jgi:tellurite resistance protein TehA-like permease
MGYFFAKRKTQITAICLTMGIILLVILIRYLPFPWRGLVDFGVVLGLSYGILSFVIFTAKALFGENYPHSPETPES